VTTAPPELSEAPIEELGPIAGWEEAWEGTGGLPARTSAPEKAGPPRRTLLVIGVLVVAGAVGLYLLFDGPIATEWYRARQRHLASDLLVGRPKVSRGQTLATLQIPKIGMNVYIVQGDAPEELRDGPGHRIGTPDPGERGNSLVFGHRDAWGGPFADL
jgi:sortase A